MQKITPCLWFDKNAEEAVNLYISIFKNSKILDVSHYGEGEHGTPGQVLMIVFQLEGQVFQALNGGPEFHFTEAISLSVNCDSQEEVDHLWNNLTEGGEESQCGWLKDKFGVSWQIVPSALGKLMSNPDPVKARRVMDAMLKMSKIDINLLQKAFDTN